MNAYISLCKPVQRNIVTGKIKNVPPFGKRLPHHRQVDLWLFPVGELTDNRRKAYEDILSSEEGDFSKKIIMQDKNTLFISSKALLRTLLCYYTNATASEWRFERNSFGRPYISEPRQFRNIRFNISHTKGLVACLISTSHEVGIDIENIFQNRDFLGISRNFFSENEVNSLYSAPSHKVGRLFYMYWTLKEAYLKARGVGLSPPLSSFWFEQTPFPRIFFSPKCGDNAKHWRFASKLISNEHLLALAIRASHEANINVRVCWAQHHSLDKLRIDSSYSIVIPVPPLNP